MQEIALILLRRPAFLFILALTFASAVAADTITADQAANHIGETRTVCGAVASATYAIRSRGRPTFLNLDRPFPNQIFTVVIWEGVRAKFSYAPDSLKGSRICVTGLIKAYEGKAEMIISGPSQIERQ